MLFDYCKLWPKQDVYQERSCIVNSSQQVFKTTTSENGKRDGNFPFLIKDKQLIAGGKWVRLSTSAASAHFGSDLLRQAIILLLMCVYCGLSALLPYVWLPEFEPTWPKINATFPFRTKKPRSLCTHCHFPAMQQNNLNPDITVSGYTSVDDSSCVTAEDSNTAGITLFQAQHFYHKKHI